MQIRTRNVRDRLATLRGILEPEHEVTFSYNDRSGRITIYATIDKIVDNIIYATCTHDYLEECPKVADILGSTSLQKSIVGSHENDLMPVLGGTNIGNKLRNFSENDGKTISFGSSRYRASRQLRMSWAPCTITISPYNNGHKIVSSNASLPVLFTSPSQENLMSLLGDLE